jgi:diguanylate cyclase (GGDEF)-like protein
MDQGGTAVRASNGTTPSRRTGSPERGQKPSWSVASSNRLLDAQIREGVPPVLFDGLNRGLLELIQKIEATPFTRGLGIEKLRQIRSLLIKAAHSLAVQSEILSELRLLALTDDLTGFYNRRGFLILSMQQLKMSRRNRQPMLLFFVDVDHLKRTNDEYGHDEGDALLLRAAAALNSTFRESDIVARLGGDEFAILAAEGLDRTSEAILSRLNKAIEEINQRGAAASLSLSIGVARFNPEDPVTVAELLTSADGDMYRHKRASNADLIDNAELTDATD